MSLATPLVPYLPGPGKLSLGPRKRFYSGIENLGTLFYKEEELSTVEKPTPCTSLKYYLLYYVGTST